MSLLLTDRLSLCCSLTATVPVSVGIVTVTVWLLPLGTILRSTWANCSSDCARSSCVSQGTRLGNSVGPASRVALDNRPNIELVHLFLSDLIVCSTSPAETLFMGMNQSSVSSASVLLLEIFDDMFWGPCNRCGLLVFTFPLLLGR